MKAGCYPKAPIKATRLVISIVCFNRLDMTINCLTRLFRHTVDFQLIITDNNSTDGTGNYLRAFREAHPNVMVVTNAKNEGFLGPQNYAFELAMSLFAPPYFCALNNDMEVGEGWLDQALSAFTGEVAIVGASNGVCSHLLNNFHGTVAGIGQTSDYVQGSLLVIRTDVAVNYGSLFDTELQFAYCEDADLSLRVRESGYRISLVPLPCRHLESQTLRSLDAATLAILTKAQAANHILMRRRWAVYLRKRTFEYEVLVKRQGAYGDVIDTTPVLAALKAKWPMCRISFQTLCPDVFSHNPHVAFAATHCPGNFDYVFDLDLAYERRPGEHTLTAYADIVGVQCPLETSHPRLYPQRNDLALALEWMPMGHRYVVAHVGPSWPGKTWPQEYWETLLRRLHEKGAKIVLVGTENSFNFLTPVLDLRGRTSLSALAGVLSHRSVFVGIDSAPSHVAQAVRCPAVILFGTVLAERKLFASSKTIGVQATVAEAPCVGLHHRLPPPVTFSNCDGACMRAISVDAVERAVLSFL